MKVSIKRLLGQFLCTLLALGIVPALYINSEFDRIKAQYDTNIKQASQNQIEYSFHELGLVMREVSNTIPAIAESSTLKRAVQSASTDSIQALQDLWLMLANGQKYYSQLRYLDLEGNETIRINYQDGKARVVPESELQNKASRRLFHCRAAAKSRRDSVFWYRLRVSKR